MMINHLRLATFFSGGFGTPELALKYLNINFENCIACEYDAYARESYIKNHGLPSLEMSHDIFEFDGKKYLSMIDLAHFSPECVDYSSAGKRKGEEGRSGGQYDKTIEIIRDMKPKMIIIENVANFAHQFKDVMDRVIGELKEVGYQVSWHIMSASDYGTPQTRKRVFIVGFLGTGVHFNTPQKIKLDTCIGDLLEDNVSDKYYLSEKALNGFKKKTEKQGGIGFMFRPRNKGETIGTLTARYAKQGITDPYIIDPKLKVIANINNAQSGRVYALDGLAPTMSANGGGLGAKNGLFDTQHGIRRLTPREAARAMGDFEDKFSIDGFSDSRLYKFIGNAIDVSTYKVLLKAVLDHSNSIDFNIDFNEANKSINKVKIVQGGLF